jgi:hypothetical protein
MIDKHAFIELMRKNRPEVVFYFRLSCDSLVRYAPQDFHEKLLQTAGDSVQGGVGPVT